MTPLYSTAISICIYIRTIYTFVLFIDREPSLGQPQILSDLNPKYVFAWSRIAPHLIQTRQGGEDPSLYKLDKVILGFEGPAGPHEQDHTITEYLQSIKCKRGSSLEENNTVMQVETLKMSAFHISH